MGIAGADAFHVFHSARQPFAERARRGPLFRNRARNDRDWQLARAAFLVSAAPRQTADGLLAGGRFDEAVWPKRMGRAVAGGACRSQWRVGGVPARLLARRTARRLLERGDSAKLAALLHHVTDADAGYFPDAICRLGGLFFLAKLALSGGASVPASRSRRRSAARGDARPTKWKLLAVASGRLGCHRAWIFDEGTSRAGYSTGRVR